MRLPRDVIGNRAWAHPRLQYQTALFVVCALLAAANFHGVDAWQATHWAFGYDSGYVKRGLVGTIYQWLEQPVSISGITVFYLALSSLVITLFLYLTSQTFGPTDYASSARDFTSSLIGIWLITAPGFVPQLVFDTGRLDVFGILLLLLALVSVERQNKNRSFVSLLALAVISIQVHEAFFFWLPAVGVALWTYRHHESRRDSYLVALFAAATMATTLHAGLSTYEDRNSLEQTVVYVDANSAFDVDRRSVKVHYRDLTDNIERTWERAWTEQRRERLALAGFVVVPYLVLLGLIARRIRSIEPRRRSRLYLLLASALAPLAMFVLGSDFGRWLSMMNVSAAAIILFLVRQHPAVIDRLPQSAAWVLIVAIIVQANLGPFGIEWLFPRADVWTTVEAVRAAL